MSGPSRHRWLLLVAVGAVALLLVVAILLSMFPSEVIPNVATTTGIHDTSAKSQTGEPFSVSDYNQSLGLRLTLGVSNRTILRNDPLSLRISLNNTLPTENTLNPPQLQAGFWQPGWNLQPCATYPIGVQIFQGNYAAGNVSQGTPLGILNPTGWNCAAHQAPEISFAPLSGDIVSPAGWWVNASAASIEYWGYWTGSAIPPSSNASFRSFPPGRYTLEGEDWWGQVVLLQFQVVANAHPLDCATIASNPAFVERTNFSASSGPLKLEGYYQDMRSNNTVVLALTTTGGSTLSVGDPFTSVIGYGFGPFIFSPDSSLRPQTWQYHAPDGTLGDPAVAYPNECSLVSVAFESNFAGVPLLLSADNQTQSFTLYR